jgi:hypothetical protein
MLDLKTYDGPIQGYDQGSLTAVSRGAGVRTIS